MEPDPLFPETDPIHIKMNRIRNTALKKEISYQMQKTIFYSSVSDPFQFDMDPDPFREVTDPDV